MPKQLYYRIAVFVLLVSLVGSVIVARADNLPLKAGQANQGDFAGYLPVILKGPACPNFFDDFSNPASGWYVGEDNKLLAEYLAGEYRVVVKRTNSSYIIDAPTCNRQDYTVEVDVRWAGIDNMGVSYGLKVGTMGTTKPKFYSFEVKPDTHEFVISSYGIVGGWELIVSGTSAAIQAGTASNHLKVTHNGNSFTAEVNGTILHTWADATEPGEKGVGLIIFSSPTQGNADARFDNFRVSSISG